MHLATEKCSTKFRNRRWSSHHSLGRSCLLRTEAKPQRLWVHDWEADVSIIALKLLSTHWIPKRCIGDPDSHFSFNPGFCSKTFLVIGVSKWPGLIQFTLISSGPNSAAIERAICKTALFDALYPTQCWSLFVIDPLILAIIAIEPAWLYFFICLATPWLVYKTPGQ